MTRLEKAMFGDRRVDQEPIVTEEIEQYRPPSGKERQFPKMSEFNEKGDPEDHYEKYELLMIRMGHNDIMLHKMFKTYLKGSASMWYKSLKPRSIGSYEQLKRKFMKYYSHLCRKTKDTEALVHCRQRANEELGDYLAQFKEEAGMVTNLDKVKVMGFLTAGREPYKGKTILSSLYDFPPKSLNDIYVRGENIRRKMESIGGYKDSRRDDKSKDSKKEGRKETDRGVERCRDRDYAVFTPLNAPISKILHEIKGKPRFVRPAKMKVPNHKKTPDKYCDYHRDKGHNTDECYHLKKLIERMIKEGELNQFVRDLRDKLGPKDNQEEQEAEEPDRRDMIRGKVKTISGGSVMDKDNKTAKKKYARQVYNLYQFGQENPRMPMTFSTEDYEDVICPHEDPLIINPIIGHLKFGRHPIQFEGTITLPVLLGKLPYTVEKLVKFYVVQIESPYNANLERPFISTFKAVESIPHLKLKFPTEKGVGEMRGDQKTARIIMLEDLEKDQDYEKPDETEKRKRAEAELSGSREALNIELEKFGADLSSPIAEPVTETEEVELYAGHSGKLVQIGRNMEKDMKEKVIV
ncbi:uncharacterized protein LOC141719418 [Apium graveolens]|uniref:uncharacterized protein LOC141719418 n=1 Tax=Apium graveolens TaxID=4045 RepID=UPI003D7BA7F1